MPKWSKVKKGDRVEVKGRDYEVVKIKPKGSKVKVALKGRGGTVFEGVMQADDKVKLAPLRDQKGAQKRWATDTEVKRGLPAGNPKATKPPAKAIGDPWETPRDKVERRLADILGAHLVGEATDEDAGYYVPPVDVATIGAHLALFHGVTELAEYGVDDMLELHDNQHASALKGVPLTVNHWHTKVRP